MRTAQVGHEPEIPVRSLKEAIINSLCHRDFSNPKSNEVAIYRDRIEIFNPGQFPYEFSPRDFIKGNKPSIPRNPLIGETLYLSEDIEKWGSGLKRIADECAAAKIKVEFQKIKTGFLVAVDRPEQAKTTSPKARLVDKLVEGLVENQRKILDMINTNNRISIKELSQAVGISTTAIDKNTAQLKEKGLLRRIGPDKGGHWETSH